MTLPNGMEVRTDIFEDETGRFDVLLDITHGDFEDLQFGNVSFHNYSIIFISFILFSLIFRKLSSLIFTRNTSFEPQKREESIFDIFDWSRRRHF